MTVIWIQEPGSGKRKQPVPAVSREASWTLKYKKSDRLAWSKGKHFQFGEGDFSLEQDSGRREKSSEHSQVQDVEKSETPRRPPNRDDEKAAWRASGKRSEFSLSGLAREEYSK